MLGLKGRMILAGACAGLALGAGLWLAVGNASAARDLSRLDAALSRVAAGPAGGRLGDPSAVLLANPLLGRRGPPAPEPSLRLDGVARNPGRSAALVSINGGTAQWLTPGATREGVTLVSVRAGQAVIETTEGTRVVSLGQVADPAATAAATPTPTSGRGPPPPADAP